ncbi:MAG TPA: hexose kinase [Aggregatilineales bacterium]|nr:hexose kinase [Aggregatilineales bacterium]
MIVTVTANTTIDQVLFVPSWELNRTLRATRQIYSLGGKPTDASWILGEMGISSLALGFCAGEMGEKARRMLHAKNVITDFIEVGGQTRLNTVLVFEDGSGSTTITTSSLEVEPQHVADLMSRFQSSLTKARVVVVGGTLPVGLRPEFYIDIIAAAKRAGATVIFDAAEPNLSAGLRASPDYIKPNIDELSGLVGRPINTRDDAYHAGRQIYAQYGTCPVITMGSAGGLAVLPDRAYYIPPLDIRVVGASGAGDAVLAGLAAAVNRGQPIEEGLRLGFAAAAAVCLTEGTAQCDRAEIERFIPQIDLQPFEPADTRAEVSDAG